MASDLTLEGYKEFEGAKLVDDTEIVNVELVRATGYDPRLFVRGELISGTTVYVPMDFVGYLFGPVAP